MRERRRLPASCVARNLPIDYRGSIVPIEVGGAFSVKFPVERAILGQAPYSGGSDETADYDEQRPGPTMILFFHLRILKGSRVVEHVSWVQMSRRSELIEKKRFIEGPKRKFFGWVVNSCGMQDEP